MRNVPNLSGEKTKSADDHLDAFDNYEEMQTINVVDANVAQSMTRSGYSLLGKAKTGLTRVEKIDHMSKLQTRRP